jgi:hypothetical protein
MAGPTIGDPSGLTAIGAFIVKRLAPGRALISHVVPFPHQKAVASIGGLARIVAATSRIIELGKRQDIAAVG